MTGHGFPRELLLDENNRRQRLVQEYYEKHHKENRDIAAAKDHEKKLPFFQKCLRRHGTSIELGLDVGCRGGTLTRELSEFGNWVGVDIDRNAIELAKSQGIPCVELDVSTAIDLQDNSFDAICMTEVLEHLPYPPVTLQEVHRILKKNRQSVFFGTVPLDYHLHRRIAVLRGKRLNYDPTHLRSFSFTELSDLLYSFFEVVEFEAMRGTQRRMRWFSSKHFVRDIAWFAESPRSLPQQAAA